MEVQYSYDTPTRSVDSTLAPREFSGSIEQVNKSIDSIKVINQQRAERKNKWF